MQSVVVRMLTGIPIAMATVALAATPALAVAGRLDRSFSGDGRVTAFPKGAMGFAMAIDAKRRILVAGPTLGAGTNFAIARFLPNGSLDRHFGGATAVSRPTSVAPTTRSTSRSDREDASS